ncbi:MAG: hypothetical protein COA58_15630 [Bacteroidetes bacterium]|nr:MAG: hypothetical protein COA58_15630 [Bacteroidota bacterium]
MQRILFFISFGITLLAAKAQEYEYRIGKQTYKVDSILQKIYAYEKIGVKLTGSTEMDSATQWLATKYVALGYSPQIDTFTFGSLTSYNVMVEKPGSESGKWIVVGAHFDSAPGSPGANDNGSGVIATIEIARIIKDIDTRIGVRIINFGAEEQGYYGSIHYVNNVLDLSEEIQLMLNLDQLGGSKGLDNSRIVCERDEDDNPSNNNALSWLKNDTLARLMSIYSDLTPILGKVERSDYESFEDKGFVVVGLYQESNYPQYHSSEDKTENMDIAATTEVIKGAIAAVLYFARIDIILDTDDLDQEIVQITPNPTSVSFRVHTANLKAHKILLTNALGQVVLAQNVTGEEVIYVANLAEGLYSVSISSDSGAFMKHSKLIIAR